MENWALANVVKQMSKVIKNYSSNDESDDEVYMFSTKCKSTDKR